MLSRSSYKAGACFFAIILLSGLGFAQSGPGDGIWSRVDTSLLRHSRAVYPDLPFAYQVFRLNRPVMRSTLSKAPADLMSGLAVVTLPMPDGSLSRFRIEHSLVVEPGLLKKFPELGATYRGQGIDDPTASVRFDLMPSGLHAIVLSASGTYYVQPYEWENRSEYISFYHKDAPSDWFDLECLSQEPVETQLPIVGPGGDSPSVISGSTLRTYRLAVGATAEYTLAYGGGTVAGALASITTTINLVDAVYERESAIHLVLVANEASIVYTDTATDGYTHENISSLFLENQAKLDSIIGSTGYDIGHVFDGSLLTGGSFSWQGQAFIGNVCNATSKAKGVDILRSVFPNDVIAYYSVAHEIGHQFSATHTMNGTGTSCANARTAATAFEPGSGSTIMGYRWNCGSQDMRSSDTYFNIANLDQIASFTTTGTGGCSVSTATGNDAPTVDARGNYTIPRLTPFALTASATDPNGDPISFNWEEADLGPTSPPDTDADGQARPIFRSYLATANPTRTFPSMSYVLNNANLPPTSSPCPIGGGTCLTGEALPTITRTMNFRVTARDNRSIGGVNSSAMQINVDGNSGPFSVTSPNSNVVVAGRSRQTVTWNVANTSNAPVSAAAVKISFSSDGGNTFPTVLAANVPNDGSEDVIIPGGNTTLARIKVEAVGNIFFDVSDTNFTVSGLAAIPSAPFDYDGDGKADVSVFRPSDGIWFIDRSQAGGFAIQFGALADKIAPVDFDGDGKTDVAVYRPTQGTWYIYNSATATITTTGFGIAEDIPAPGDYDGDGKADVAIYRPSTATWWLNRSTAGLIAIQFGLSGDIPVPGDFDGDGKADLVVYRPSNGVWYMQRSTAGGFAIQFGNATDKIVPADYDGDGKLDVAIYRPLQTTWYIVNSSNGQYPVQVFGLATDIPAPADYDGDGKADVAIFRPTNGQWWMNRTTAGLTVMQFGITGDRPTPSAFGN
ncbi:hypothetical protein BH10ACI3_BH10ACI3_02820 [soil metagenome]